MYSTTSWKPALASNGTIHSDYCYCTSHTVRALIQWHDDFYMLMNTEVQLQTPSALLCWLGRNHIWYAPMLAMVHLYWHIIRKHIKYHCTLCVSSGGQPLYRCILTDWGDRVQRVIRHHILTPWLHTQRLIAHMVLRGVQFGRYLQILLK